MDTRHLSAVERWTMILAAVVIAAGTASLSRPTSFAISVGAGLMVLNAFALRRIGDRVLRAARPGVAVLLLNLKMALLIALVLVAIRILRLDTAGFLIGVSVFPVAMVATAVQAALSDRGSDEPAPDSTPATPLSGGR